MAAGLPVVVSDWNGYRETVRDGVDGFRIDTWAPQAGAGEHMARAREAGSLPMDVAHWAAASFTSVDLDQLAERLTRLVADADLRRTMGAAGQARARETYGWDKVFAAYQALWAEQEALRAAATDLGAAPKVTGGGLDFFAAFGHYPTHTVGLETSARLAPGATLESFKALAASGLFPLEPAPRTMTAALWPLLAEGPLTARDASARLGWTAEAALRILAALAKMGIVRLGTERPELAPTGAG
jgi:hypothetical protein